jgi:hypothetical protein
MNFISAVFSLLTSLCPFLIKILKFKNLRLESEISCNRPLGLLNDIKIVISNVFLIASCLTDLMALKSTKLWDAAATEVKCYWCQGFIKNQQVFVFISVL